MKKIACLLILSCLIISGAALLLPVAALASVESQDIAPKMLPSPPVPPAELPLTERDGDDLIVHNGVSKIRLSGFMKDVNAPGQTKSFNVEFPDRGKCLLTVNEEGKAIGATCDR